MTDTRSPLKDKPLRNPGQSVREMRFDLAFDKVFSPLLLAALTILFAAIDWLRYFYPSTGMPWLSSLVAGMAVVYAIWHFRRYWPQVLALRLAEDGEKAVGQHLEALRTRGYVVFHDLVGDGFNVDHVIIGPAGVFTIETKTWSKPLKGSPEISFDGETLLANGKEPERNPLTQVKAQANWLRQLLSESTGKEMPVRPVLLFPGWFVKDARSNRRDLWVLEPKALGPFLANEQTRLSPEDVSLAGSHLSRFIRAEEKRREATR